MQSEQTKTTTDLSLRTTVILLVSVMVLGMILPASGWPAGIRFSDEAFYATAAWRIADTGTLSFPASDISEHGRVTCFYSEGRNNRLYSLNPIGFSVVLVPFYWLGGWRCLLHANFLFALLLTLACYAAARRFFSRFVSIIAIFLLVMSPIYIFYTTLTMTHIFVCLIQCAGVWILLPRKGLPGPVRAGFTGLLWGLLFCVRLDAALLPVFIAAACLIPRNPDTHWNSRLLRKQIVVILIAAAAFALGASSQLVYRKLAFGSVLSTSYNGMFLSEKVVDFSRIPTAMPRAFSRINQFGLPVTFGAALAGYILLIFKRPRNAALLLAWAAPFFLLYLAFRFGSKHIYNVRYFFPMFPALVFSAAYLFQELPLRRIHRITAALIFCLAAGITGAWNGYYTIQDRNLHINPQAEMLEAIHWEVPTGAVLFTPGDIGLILAMENKYEVRDNLSLLGPLQVSSGPLKTDGKWKKSVILEHAVKFTGRHKVPGLLQRTVKQFPGRCFLVAYETRTQELKSFCKAENISLHTVYTVKSPTNNYHLYQIIPFPI